jgi:hypothetical protein
MTKQVRQSITPTHVLGSTGTAEGDTLGHRALADLKADLGLNAATGLPYSNSTSGLTATNVQAAIDELASSVEQGVVAQFTYDRTTTSPAASIPRTVPPFVKRELYDRMRGCVLNADGSVNYYLKADDWTKKADGTTADLTGPDGNVMVEIPRFYFRVDRIGTEDTWTISPIPVTGLELHPGFIKDGTERSVRYYSAYDACVQLASDGSYISGANLDNASSLVNTSTDKLASVKGIYPMVGLTRAEFRALAANNGTGWRQLDFPLWNAVAMLYLVEAQTFFSQDVLGNGNTNGSYVSSSAVQSDSPHTIAGFRDDVANGSTTPANGQGTATRPGTVAMKYRGIENLFGNCWNWADAINVNVTATGNVHLANDNDRANYADGTATNHTLITSSLPTTSANIQTLLPLDAYFLAESLGGTTSQYITDRHVGSASASRVVRVGGGAGSGGDAGVFALDAAGDASVRNRVRGGRLAF